MTDNLGRRALASVLFMFAAMATSLVISTVTRFVLAAQLGAAVFGNFTIAQAAVGFVMLFANTQGDRYIVVGKQRRSDMVATVISTELLLWLLLTAGWVFARHLYWDRIVGNVSWTLASLLLLQGLSFPLGRPRALLERDLNFKIIALVNASTQFVMATVAIVLSFYVKNELPLILVALVPLGQSLVFLRLGRTPIRLRIHRPMLPAYAKLCVPLMISGIVVYLNWNGDRFLLDQYVSRRQLGFYGWAFSLGTIVLRAKDVIARVLFPVFAEMLRTGQEEDLRRALSRLYRAMALVYGLILPALVVAAPELVKLAGSNWHAAGACLQIAFLVFSVRTFNGFLEPILVPHGRTLLLMSLAIINAVLIVVGGFLALTRWPSIETMAVVILLANVMIFFACMRAVFSVTRANLIAAMGPAAIMSVISYLVMYAWTRWLGSGHLMLGMGIVVGMLFYLLFTWRDIYHLVRTVRQQVFPDASTTGS